MLNRLYSGYQTISILFGVVFIVNGIVGQIQWAIAFGCSLFLVGIVSIIPDIYSKVIKKCKKKAQV